jgi:hypothetical protein
MPDESLHVAVTRIDGSWGAARHSGPARLSLTNEALLIEGPAGESVRLAWIELSGGALRSGALTLHGASGSATLEAQSGLDSAWAALLAHACALPEFARGHRALGSRRGGSPGAQARFLAPLLQARKRLEDERDLDMRVAAFEARTLRERIESALQQIARDAYPDSHADRRALQAELEESMEVLFASLDALGDAGEAYRRAAEHVRFNAWREWVAVAARVFAAADAAWCEAAKLIPNPART